ncbi:MAG: type II toxin-antitoxin system PemK/MazF family toxin [Candidatus Campbellbacteria bacterium]|nr:type II toxin-antitoxin system PemK/MazF family toxin [Candidatus Campbellbacteria bacterium]
MEKDFDTWNEVKKQTNERTQVPFFHEREVWWCSFGVNIGTEQDGAKHTFRRPVVVLKRLSRYSCLVTPLTTSEKKHHFRMYVGELQNRSSHAILSQIRVVDIRRFAQKIGYLDENIFYQLRKTIKDIL